MAGTADRIVREPSPNPRSTPAQVGVCPRRTKSTDVKMTRPAANFQADLVQHATASSLTRPYASHPLPSTRPDKAGRQIPDMDPYHFINFPKDATTYDQQGDCKLRNCAIEAISWYMQAQVTGCTAK